MITPAFSPFVRASLALHAAAAGALAQPELWPWALGAVAADHAALTAAGLWPRSRLLGPNWTRLPAAAAARGEIALTMDDGPDPDVTPRVLEVLERHGMVATFFCIGERAARHPALCRDMLACGHAVENHSAYHRKTFSLLGPWRMAREVAAGNRTLAAITGRAPRFFRPPAGLRNPFLQPVLAHLEVQLASWTRRAYDTRNGDAADVLARLTRGLAAGDILLLHDGNAARTAAGRPVVLEVLPPLCEAIRRAGLRPVTLHEALGGAPSSHAPPSCLTAP